MIARIRGEHDTHWGRWRPSASRENTTVSPRKVGAAVRVELAPVGIAGGRLHGDRRVLRWLVVVAAVIVAAYLAGSWSVAELSSGPAQPRLPVTPRAWLDAY
jgi:hypothetical protein